MIDGYVTVLMIVCGVLLAAGLIASVMSRPPGLFLLALAAVLETAVVAQAVIAVVGLIQGARVEGLALFLAYTAFAVVVLPIGALFAVAEPSRWSGVVLGVASLALVVTLWRLSGVWVSADG